MGFDLVFPPCRLRAVRAVPSSWQSAHAKADVEAFIDQGKDATRYYEHTLAHQGDVAAAKEALAAAKAQYARTCLLDYDSVGSSSNPGKVSRGMNANFRLVPDADARLEHEQKIAEVLGAGNKCRI